MRRNASGRALAVLVALACALVSMPSRADDPPPLTPPAGLPPLEGPQSSPAEPPATGPGSTAPPPIPAPPMPVAPAPKPAAPKPAAARTERPMLALPGVTMPPTRPVRTAPPLPPASEMPASLAPTADGGLPPLVSPGSRRPGAGTEANAPSLPPSPASRFRGRVIESVPSGEAPTLPTIDLPPIDSRPGRIVSPAPPLGTPRRPGERLEIDGPERSGSRPSMPMTEPDADEKNGDLPKTAPTRRSPFLGGMLTSPFGPRSTTGADSTIRAEPRTDPAADAILKRRIEKQAHDAVGDRVKELNVRVVGRSVTIQAHGTRFLQRRSIRKALENLPGLSGYRSTIDVKD
jgi:hypothetical protein